MKEALKEKCRTQSLLKVSLGASAVKLRGDVITSDQSQQMTSEPIRAVKRGKTLKGHVKLVLVSLLTKFTDSHHKHNVEAIQHNYNTFTYLNPQTCKYKSFLLNNEKKHLQMEGNHNLTAVCTTDPLASQKS